jgi:hypothetical protein
VICYEICKRREILNMPILRANGPLVYITLKQFVDYQQKKAEQQRQAQALTYPPSFSNPALNGDQFYKHPNRSSAAPPIAFSGATPSKMQEDAKQRRDRIRRNPKATALGRVNNHLSHSRAAAR